MDIRTEVISQLQVVFIQHEKGVAGTMNSRQIKGDIIGNVRFHNPLTAGARNNVFFRVLQIQYITECFLGKYARLNSGIDNKFEGQHTVEHDGDNNQIIAQLKWYLDLSPPFFKNKSKRSLAGAKIEEQ
jgi:hypothetical protein